MTGPGVLYWTMIAAAVLAGVQVAVETAFAGEGGGAGIAAKYPGDVGIAGDPAVIMADDFESWTGETVFP